MLKINLESYQELVANYKKAPVIFQATKYWDSYENKINDEIEQLDPNYIRSGKYQFLNSFGFRETIFKNLRGLSRLQQFKNNIIRRYTKYGGLHMPYSIDLSSIREMAFRHCELYGKVTNSKLINTVETTTFGSPEDIFSVQGKKYTMEFLNFYLRYCFVNNVLQLKGNEIIVELGSGSGHQIEILKRLYPNLTILCFDLPAQLYACQTYISNIFNKSEIVGFEETMNCKDTANIEKGKIHFFGNWQIPIIEKLPFDIFWNAASFGEMEPNVVKNYLSFVNNAKSVYLLQARHGKEDNYASGVKKKTSFDDYNRMLSNYSLIEEDDAYYAAKKMDMSGGYFQALWKKSNI